MPPSYLIPRSSRKVSSPDVTGDAIGDCGSIRVPSTSSIAAPPPSTYSPSRSRASGDMGSVGPATTSTSMESGFSEGTVSPSSATLPIE